MTGHFKSYLFLQVLYFITDSERFRTNTKKRMRLDTEHALYSSMLENSMMLLQEGVQKILPDMHQGHYSNRELREKGVSILVAVLYFTVTVQAAADRRL